jgi:hypothetical protein
VTVRVSPQGALLDLKLDDEACDLRAADLAALVLETARTATEKVAGELRSAVAPLEQPLDLDLSTEATADWPGSDTAAR